MSISRFYSNELFSFEITSKQSQEGILPRDHCLNSKLAHDRSMLTAGDSLNYRTAMIGPWINCKSQNACDGSDKQIFIRVECVTSHKEFQH